MIRFFAETVRGPWVLALVIVAYAFGFYALNVLPQWNILVDAQGGSEIQARAFASPSDVRAALAQIEAAGARHAALQFYAIDVPNFTLLGAAGAALVGFGLRRFGIEKSPARFLIAVPLFAAFADATETASLAACLLITDIGFAENAAYAITAKRIAAMGSLAVILLAPIGLVWWLIRLAFRPKAQG